MILVAFEGAEGVGKSTLMKSVGDALEGSPFFNNISLSREPGGTKLGQKLRTIMKEGDIDISDEALMMMFLADRAEHVNKTIQSSDRKGEGLVLTDRYDLSTLIYQGWHQQKMSQEKILKIQEMIGIPRPDIYVICTADKPHRKEDEFFDKQINGNWIKFNNKYLSVAKKYMDNPNKPKIIHLNTTKLSKKECVEKCKKHLIKYHDKLFNNERDCVTI